MWSMRKKVEVGLAANYSDSKVLVGPEIRFPVRDYTVELRLLGASKTTSVLRLQLTRKF